MTGEAWEVWKRHSHRGRSVTTRFVAVMVGLLKLEDFADTLLHIYL